MFMTRNICENGVKSSNVEVQTRAIQVVIDSRKDSGGVTIWKRLNEN